MKSRAFSIQSGLPAELWGLLHANYYSRNMFEGTAADYAFYDACKIRTADNGVDGLYLVAGSGTTGGTASTSVLVLAGGIPIKYLSVIPATYTGVLFGACGSLPNCGDPAMHTAWLIGHGDAKAVRVSGVGNALNTVNYVLNGAVLASGVPIPGSPVGLAPSANSGRVMAYGVSSVTSHEFMSHKPTSDATTAAWSVTAVPGTSTGYIKARQSYAGWTMAVTATDGVHISTTSASTTMIRDTTHPGIGDIDYSVNDDLYIATDFGSLYTAPAGWGSGGPATWTTHALPIPGYVPTQVVAMDVVSTLSAPAEKSLGVRTWYLVVCRNGDLCVSFLTKDFVNWISVQVPGTVLIDGPVLSQPTFKFVHDRLFAFGTLGFTVSGALGEVVAKF